MARVEIPAPGDLVIDTAGNVLSGRAVTLKVAGTSTDATHYSALTAGTSTTGGLVTLTDGTIGVGGNKRYVDEGSYDLTISGRSRQIEAVSGGVSGSLAGLVFLVPAPTGVEATDTAAIQAQLTAAAAAGGGTVMLRVGTYTINATLTIASFVTLAGQGPGVRSSEFSITTPGAAILKLGGTKDFIMAQNSDSTNGNSGILIRDVAFHQNVTPDVATVAVIQLNKARRTTLERVSVYGGTTTNRRGLYVIGGSEIVLVRGCFFEGCGVHATGTSNTVRVMHSEIGQGAVFITGGFGHHLIGNEIFKDGISSDDTVGDCIRFDTVKESIVAFNNVRGAYNGHGILFDRGTVRSHIYGNHVYEHGRKTAGTWSGIQLDSGNAASPTEKNTVTGNSCYDRQATKTQQYGVVVKSASGTQTNYNRITGNTLLDNRSADALNVQTGLVNTYRDNRIVAGQQDYQTIATDAIFTLTPFTSPEHTRHTGTLTANRAVTLSTTNANSSTKFKITRTGGGAFTLDVGTGPLKSLATNTWAEFQFDGTNWFLAEYGTL